MRPYDIPSAADVEVIERRAREIERSRRPALRFPSGADFERDFLVAQERARRIFDRVADLDDWRAPIRAAVAVEEVRAATDAIIFFTGAPVRTTALRADGGDEIVAYLVESDGYRAGPTGP